MITLENIWAHNHSVPFVVGNDATEGFRGLGISLKNLILGQIRVGLEGAFTLTAGGVRYTPSDIGAGHLGKENDFSHEFTAADVGRQINIANATTLGNNGTFVISAVDPSGLWCEYDNENGVAETFNASARVLAPGWESLPNGRSPWRCADSYSVVNGLGSFDDGVDRWLRPADRLSNTSGSRTWFRMVNEISGLEINFWDWTNSSANRYIHMEITVSPELGFTTPGTTSNRPGASDEATIHTRSTTLFQTSAESAADDTTYYFHCAQDNSGQTVFFVSVLGVNVAGLIAVRGLDVDQGWDGNRNAVAYARENFGALPVFSYENLVEDDRFAATIDRDGLMGGPYPVLMYMSTTYSQASSVGEFQRDSPYQPIGEITRHPIGLVTDNPAVRARFGRVADLWFGHQHRNVGGTDAGRMDGEVMPDTSTRQLVRLEDMIFPWNGTRIERGR